MVKWCKELLKLFKARTGSQNKLTGQPVHEPQTSVRTGEILHLQEKMQYAYECYKQEMERKKTVESKASMFIATITFVATVLIGLSTRQILEGKFSSVFAFFLQLLLACVIFFVLRTLWYSIKTLEKRAFYYLSLNDFRDERGDDFYYKMISEFDEAICRNQPIINRKVDHMMKAQYSFKVAIGLSVVYILLLVTFLVMNELTVI
jgi:hypothetical protein